MEDLMKEIRKRCYIHEENVSTKPQIAFKKIPCDNARSHFKHLSLNSNNDNIHPYEKDVIEGLPAPLFDVQMPSEIIKDAHEWIETEQGLHDLVGELKLEKFFAVDTEHHSVRSYLGLIALLQISTKNRDYLIDTIKLHDSMEILRPIFADSSICKVLHGATQDIIWLQRDFHIYIVNMFDTGVGYQKLHKMKEQPGLALLLQKYCNVKSDKSLRTKDWRTRPLTEDMKIYAVMDTRYLMYIASTLMTELNDKENNLYELACQASNKLCLKQYIKAAKGDSPSKKDMYNALKKYKGESVLLSSNMEKAREICLWRDIMGRVHDESLGFVMSEEHVFSLACGTPLDDLKSHSPVVMSHMTGLMDVLDKGIGFDDGNPIIEDCIGAKGTCMLTPYNSGLQNTLLNFKPTTTNYVTKSSGKKTPKLSSSFDKTRGSCDACKESVERRILFKTIPPCYKDHFSVEFHYVFNKLNINICEICQVRAIVANNTMKQVVYKSYGIALNKNDVEEKRKDEYKKGKKQVKKVGEGKFGDHSDLGKKVVEHIMSLPPIAMEDQRRLIQQIKHRFDAMPEEKANQNRSVEEFAVYYGRLAVFVQTWRQRLLQILAAEKGKRI